ncbi:arylsulfatase [Undibacterium sp. Ren11W]|uniref:arylsulfatase n=1 Tax=Undibacterium sp. Ren11W TaxID=3413045 RepID=UPI003BF1AF4E
MMSATVATAATQPNIVVIWGDDIGISNISAYSDGLMGYRTPNIDRVAKEGMRFTDYYAEQSSTAGRSTFITGQAVVRTGLSKVGLPGAELGLKAKDITLAEVLKSKGYSTGQFGKNHLGDRDEHLPCAHGFDEFFGNLYHLNAEEEPENRDYPKDPEFRKKYGPRGVLKCTAGGKIENTGPLTKKRMETMDDEIVAGANDFIARQAKSGKPFFTWVNTTGMHFRTHNRAEIEGQAGKWLGEYADGMVEHDKRVGRVLKQIDDLGLADNTIVIYATDNGVHMNSWPDAGMTPFRSEKNTNWEGAYRVPAMIRWPGHIKAGTVSNGIFSGLDWMPTLAAAAGDDKIKENLAKGTTVGGKSYKVHLDGYNQIDYLTGKSDKSARNEFFYFNDDGAMVGMRYDNWKFVFEEQESKGTLRVWAQPFTKLRVPKIFNLRLDPFERADITSNTYYDWLLDRAFMLVPAQAEVMKFYMTFKDFPPSQKAASFSIDQIMDQMNKPAAQ